MKWAAAPHVNLRSLPCWRGREGGQLQRFSVFFLPVIETTALWPIVPENAAALKPANLDFVQAASIPMVGLTSWQALKERMHLKPGQKVLEIGTGSGYQAAILVELGAKVYTIEFNRNLYEKTKIFLPQLGYKPFFFYGDGSKGLPAKAPFDKIVVTAGAPVIPSELTDQLSENGILIIPVGNRETQKMMKLTKKGVKLLKEEFDQFAFVPLLGESGWGS